MRYSSPDGQQLDLFGPPRAHANPSRKLGNGVEWTTNGICGPSSAVSSASVDLQSSSASKSDQPELSGDLLNQTKICRKCKTEKPYSEFYVNSKGNRPWVCKACCRMAERRNKRKHAERVARNQKEWRYKKRGFALVNVAKHRAQRRGMDFDLDPQRIQERIDAGFCELTGIPFDLTTPRSWNAPSLDRIDPIGGYTMHNVRVVLYSLNVMANTWGHQRILEIASAIMANRKKASNDLSERLGERLQQLLSRSGSIEYEQTWSRRVTPSGHVYWAHTASAHRTSDSASTGWPTPNTPNGGRGISHATWRGATLYDKQGKKVQFGLENVAQLAGWGTSSATERSGQGPDNVSLMQQAKPAGWLTPKCPSGGGQEKRQTPGGGLRKLEDQTLLTGWATPASRDWRDGRASEETMQRNSRPLNEQVTQFISGTSTTSSPVETGKPGVLNPAFALWLMGFPSDWLMVAPGKLSRGRSSSAGSEMPSSPR